MEPAPPATAGSVPGAQYSWTHIYWSYLAKGTIGNCADDKVMCHAKEMPDPPKSYKWLDSEGYMGSSPALTSDAYSCLSWFGGDMPNPPKQSKMAVDEMTMWAIKGALNN
jgi:hypothetical protein